MTVRADDGSTAELHGEHVVLAAGSVARTIPGFEVDGRIVLTSDEVLMLEKLPTSAAVIGGGAIGCEFASMMSDLGVQVTILEALPKILPGCDADVANVVVRSFNKRGIQIKTGVPVTGHEPQADGGTIVRFGSGEEVARRPGRRLGRAPSLRRPARSRAAPRCRSTRGFVKVDEWCRTDEPGVYAIGDLINTPQLAHVGFAEAIMLVKDILGEKPHSGRLRQGPLGDLLLTRGRVGGILRGGGQGGWVRRGHVEAPVPRQQPRADPR